MKKEEIVFENEFLKEDITLVVCENMETKTTIMTYLLYDYAIKENKEVLLYAFDRRCEYYNRHLLSYISKIDKKLLIKYLYPWLGLSHNNTDMINRFYFVSSIERIQQSNLFMIEDNSIYHVDYLDSILEMIECDSSKYIIIDDFDLLLQKTKYGRKEVLRKLREYSAKYEVHFILFCYKKEESLISSDISNIMVGKQTFLSSFKKLIRILEIMIYKNQKLEKKITLEYNKNNYEINRRDVNE